MPVRKVIKAAQPGEQPAGRLLCFVMPFASLAAVHHAQQLLELLCSCQGQVLFIGDRRVNTRINDLVVLKELDALAAIPRGAGFTGAIQWVARLSTMMASATWSVWQARQQFDTVVCFLGVYYTPLLLLCRLIRKGVISFEPTNALLATRSVYQHQPAGTLIMLAIRWLRAANRRLATLCCIESLHEISQGELGGYQDKVRQANLFIDTRKYSEAIHFNERVKTVAYIGRLSEEKGVWQYVMAAKQLRERGISFLIVGDGPLRPAIQSYVEDNSLKFVQLTGWVRSDEIPQYLNQARLLVLPSSGEGLPNILLEAMACCTPVLATPVGAVPALIQDRHNGFILINTQPENIASQIVSSLAHPQLEKIAQRGRETVVRNYSFEASKARWQAVINEIS